MKAELRGSTPTYVSLPHNPSHFINPNNHGSSLSSALNGTLGSLDGACIEKLLLHCASALESNDVTLAQQVMWVLNNVAASHGDPNQRLTSWFLRALVARASRVCPNAMAFGSTPSAVARSRPMTVTELAGYVDLTPWHRFGFCASNGAIYAAVKGRERVHVLDFSITHCMQWPTLIDELAKRPEGPPALRITVPSARPPVPPLLNVSVEEVGLRLAYFAKSRNVPFEFSVMRGNPGDELAAGGQLDPSALGLRDDETLVVNCQSFLRYVPPDEPRDRFLEAIRALVPRIVTVSDEDSEMGAAGLAARIAACFNYMWIPFDALETFMAKDSAQRAEYEADVGQKIENIVGAEGAQRIERPEAGARAAARMRRAGFTGAAFGEETVRDVRTVLEEHASGWGMKREEEMLVLTWKGHSTVFTAAWVPNGFDE